jgi:hypothetical protein
MKFKVTEFIKKYMKVGDDYQYVEVEKYYTADTWDDLQNLLMMLIDFSDVSIRFEVKKEVPNEQ